MAKAGRSSGHSRAQLQEKSTELRPVETESCVGRPLYLWRPVPPNEAFVCLGMAGKPAKNAETRSADCSRRPHRLRRARLVQLVLEETVAGLKKRKKKPRSWGASRFFNQFVTLLELLLQGAYDLVSG